MVKYLIHTPDDKLLKLTPHYENTGGNISLSLVDLMNYMYVSAVQMPVKIKYVWIKSNSKIHNWPLPPPKIINYMTVHSLY